MLGPKKKTDLRKKTCGKWSRGKERDLPSLQRGWGESERIIYPKNSSQAQESGREVKRTQTGRERQGGTVTALSESSFPRANENEEKSPWQPCKNLICLPCYHMP